MRATTASLRRGRAVLVALIVAAVLGSAAAGAHPLGQRPQLLIQERDGTFTFGWLIAPDDARVLADHLVLGLVRPEALPEQRAFQSYVRRHLSVRADGRACPIAIGDGRAVSSGYLYGFSFACGDAVDGLRITMRLLTDIDARYQTIYAAQTPAGVKRGVFTASVPTVDIDLTSSAPPAPVGSPAPQGSGLASRIDAMILGQSGSISFAVALLFAFALGALHAITPGHGKTITAAYLVGARGSTRHALSLGGIVAGTHAISVAALGAIALAADQALPRRVQPWLEIGTAVLILGLAVSLFRGSLRHSHGDGEAMPALPFRRLAAIGLVGGLVPSPEAIGIALVAFQVARWTTGAILLAAFSAGLAAVVLGVALAAVRGAGMVQRVGDGRLAHLAPRLAAGVFLVMGIVVAAGGIARL